MMKIPVIVFSLSILLLLPTSLVSAEVFQERLEGTLNVYTNQLVFAPGDPIFVHGLATAKEPIIIRLFTPDGTIAEFEQLMTNTDGSFQHFLMEWDNPTTNLPYGTYILEVISNQQGGISKKLEIKFRVRSAVWVHFSIIYKISRGQTLSLEKARSLREFFSLRFREFSSFLFQASSAQEERKIPLTLFHGSRNFLSGLMQKWL